MKSAVIIPEICKKPDSDFEGTVEMRPPLVDERFEYFEATGIEITDGAAVDVKPGGNIKAIRALLPYLKKHIIAVNIKRKSDGEMLTTHDDLSMDPEASGILIELALLLVTGFKPTKNS